MSAGVLFTALTTFNRYPGPGPTSLPPFRRWTLQPEAECRFYVSGNSVSSMNICCYLINANVVGLPNLPRKQSIHTGSMSALKALRGPEQRSYGHGTEIILSELVKLVTRQWSPADEVAKVGD